MADLPEGLHVGDLYVFPVGPPQDGNFSYIPIPALDSNPGTASATLLSSPKGATLSMSAVWKVNDSVLADATKPVSAKYPQAQASNISFSYPELQSVQASVKIVSSSGTHTIGPNPASGMEGNRAVVTDTLTSTEKLAVTAALQGKSGILLLTYSATLTLHEVSTVQISGDLAPLIKAILPPPPTPKKPGLLSGPPKPAPFVPPTPQDCLKAVEDAIKKGQLKLVHTDSLNVSDQTKRSAESELRSTVASQLCAKVTKMGAQAAYLTSFLIDQKTSKPEDVVYQISRSTDLGAWIAQTASKALITETGAVIAEPVR